jgi:hypothetical protein
MEFLDEILCPFLIDPSGDFLTGNRAALPKNSMIRKKIHFNRDKLMR